MKSIEWRNGTIRFLDQTRLPLEECYVETRDYRVIAEAIRSLKIRGAPLIGIASAYAAGLASLECTASDPGVVRAYVQSSIDELAATRPTAVNLFWALQRSKRVLDAATSLDDARRRLIEEAIAIHREDEEMCRRIGEFGATLVPDTCTAMTHCNTGALATGGEGTAQSILTTAHRLGKRVRVYANETRPLLQGARLTAWELLHAGVDVTLLTDNAAAFLMKSGQIDLVVVGADRIAANGDVANKVGTYNLAVLAKHHGIPFYVAAPGSTIDPSTASGDCIPIEQRSASEVTNGFGSRTAPEGVNVYAPAFDVTPASLVTAIITDRGIRRPPYDFSKSNTSKKLG
jgi:methylthioribose-1-phosphate isomerase